MVNAKPDFRARAMVLLLAALMLSAAAWNRGAEYDEQYTLFVTAGTPRPVWPQVAFPAGEVVALQAGRAGPVTIALDLRRTDVHPPLYFWAAAVWRAAVGQGLFAVRLLSLLCGLGTLVAVGMVARRCAIPPATAMLLTLGCYGFAYTAVIARGFALAQFLALAGLVAVLSGRRILAGFMLGGAVATNYLAVFVALAVAMGAWRNPWRVCVGFSAGAAAAAWFFIAQRDSRGGQFPPFELLPALLRLARYGAATLTGGLPLYVPEAAQMAVSGCIAVGLVSVAGMVVWRWRRAALPEARYLLVAAALAPPLGLLLLGLVFDNTPIELRYLSFAAPFIALLVASTRPNRLVLAAIFIVQAASLSGLIGSPETMQPARATAIAAIPWVGEGAVLLPRGSDGVGIVGAFAGAVPPETLLLVAGHQETADSIRRRLAPFRRVVLASLAQDNDSRAALPAMEAALRAPGWREIGRGFNVIAYQRVD